jgi:hypothetical protein
MSAKAMKSQQKRRAPPSRPAAVTRGKPDKKRANVGAIAGSRKAKAAKTCKDDGDSENEDLHGEPLSPDVSPPSSPSKARVPLGDLTNVAVVEELQSQVKWLKENMMKSLQHGVHQPKKIGSGKVSALTSDRACHSYLLRVQGSCGLS